MGLALVPPNFFGIEPGPDLPASVGSEGLGGLSTFRVWPALNVRACISREHPDFPPGRSLGRRQGPLAAIIRAWSPKLMASSRYVSGGAPLCNPINGQ
jgi:hypothetical protein